MANRKTDGMASRQTATNSSNIAVGFTEIPTKSSVNSNVQSENKKKQTNRKDNNRKELKLKSHLAWTITLIMATNYIFI